ATAAAPRRQILDVLRRLLRKDQKSSPGGAPGPSKGSRGAAGEPPQTDAIPSLQGRRILIAEDVATNQMLLKALLAPTGAAVEVVTDGAAALRRHGDEPFDLILMDLQMPGTGGIASLKSIRALGGPVGSVPVVALTAYAREADRRLALEAGMDAYLPKPFVVAEFYDLLQRLLPASA
ncbi:MAG TPA: response regulator, partial [Thermohalobaculum sp.]|nr:response regulator [Thermohalobaculum sp.]